MTDNILYLMIVVTALYYSFSCESVFNGCWVAGGQLQPPPLSRLIVQHADYQLAASVELILSYMHSLGFTIKLNQDVGHS